MKVYRAHTSKPIPVRAFFTCGCFFIRKWAFEINITRQHTAANWCKRTNWRATMYKQNTTAIVNERETEREREREKTHEERARKGTKTGKGKWLRGKHKSEFQVYSMAKRLLVPKKLQVGMMCTKQFKYALSSQEQCANLAKLPNGNWNKMWTMLSHIFDSISEHVIRRMSRTHTIFKQIEFFIWVTK